MGEKKKKSVEINDLPEDAKRTHEEMAHVKGGTDNRAGFENPIISFENPIISTDNPLVAKKDGKSTKG